MDLLRQEANYGGIQAGEKQDIHIANQTSPTSFFGSQTVRR
jgi:hypothetical protein